MAVNITINGVVYSFPTEGDQDWGPQVTAFAQAIAAAVLYKSGGVFTLTADADFGGAFGLLAIFKSRSLNIADAGVLRLANLDPISWRNAANSGNLALTVDASDQLLFNGSPVSGGGFVSPMTTPGDMIYLNSLSNPARLAIGAEGRILTVSSGLPFWQQPAFVNVADTGRINLELSSGTLTGDIVAGSIVDVFIDAAAAIAFSKMAALTASRAVVTDGSGFVTAAAATTAAEIGFVNGVTSAIQNQIDGKISASVLTANGSIPMRYGGITQQIPIGTDRDVLRVQGDAAGWEPYLPPRMPVLNLTNGYVFDDAEHGTFFRADTSSLAISATLPLTHTAGTYYEIKDVGSNASVNNIVISPSGGALINNGGAYAIMTDSGSVKIISDSINWWTIGGV